jgi:Fe2+ transport system protein B
MIAALVGNPNCGKTTLYNALTGGNRKTGNFPGVTVDVALGKLKGGDIEVADLPGIYSLSPFSGDEEAARAFLDGRRPDAVINIIDATNPVRSLYLTLELLEAGEPVIVALNMIDEVEESGGAVNSRRLSALLGAPVADVAAVTGRGVSELKKEIENYKKRAVSLPYSGETYEAVKKAGLELGGTYAAIKFFEGEGKGNPRAEEIKKAFEKKIKSTAPRR